MSQKQTNIIIAEPSQIIYEGLLKILSRYSGSYNFLWAHEISHIEQQLNAGIPASLVIINPLLIANQSKTFSTLKKQMPQTAWAGIVYSLFDTQLTAQFDALISINDQPERIISTVEKLLSQSKAEEDSAAAEMLSERETEVLKLLVSGHSNREIAERLFISTHTVITHRKNISQKTGIRSVSGLTIYAVVNNLISLQNTKE